LLIFAIVSTIVAFNVDSIDNLRTDELLKHKGVIVRRANNATITYGQGQALYNDILDYTEKPNSSVTLDQSMMYTFSDIDPRLRIFNLDIHNPWLADFAKPSLLDEGRYPRTANEILVPAGSLQHRSISLNNESYEVSSELAVGQMLNFKSPTGDEINLKVVGTFDGSNLGMTNPSKQLWLFMDQSKYEDMLSLFGLTQTQNARVHQLSFVVDGLILVPSTYDQVGILNQQIQTMLEDKTTYGDFRNQPDSLPAPQTKRTSKNITVFLGFTIIGGVLLSTLFAYLISRFRRREIAILKAMGYSHSSVRISLIGELLTTSFSGFFFGLFVAQLLLFDWVKFDFSTLIRLPAIGIAFLIMVVIAFPGMVLTSRRVLSVSPAEAFRDN